MILSLVVALVAQQVPEGVECGLGKEFHAGRRAALAERLESGVVVLRGLPDPRANVEFRQDKAFWYLTGIESPGAAVVLDLDAGEEVLLLPEPSRMWEFWNGERWDAGDDWIEAASGFADVRQLSELEAVLAERLEPGDVVWTGLQPWTGLAGSYDTATRHEEARKADPWDARPTREEALRDRLVERFEVEVRDLSPTLNDLRRVKTPEELAALRRAARAGALAIAEAMRSTRPGTSEADLDALMGFVHALEGADGPAYDAIVGSGPNSCVLHYLAADRTMRDGEVVLVDFGPEVDHYVTDITRTWPVGGRFEGRVRELYEAVLEAQEAGIAAVRPGATLADVSRAAYAVLQEKGLVRRPDHGACHYVGTEVHDPGGYMAPLEPGVVFTIEPGLYDAETGIGIRIEDVVVCTEDGAEVLTGLVPKDVAAIEALIAEEGVLERIGRAPAAAAAEGGPAGE